MTLALEMAKMEPVTRHQSVLQKEEAMWALVREDLEYVVLVS